MTVQELVLACVLDVIVGDPRWLPHPVRLMGRAVMRYEKAIRAGIRSAEGLRIVGIALALGLPVISYAAGWLAIEWAERLHASLGKLLVVFLAFTTLAARDLVNHSLAVWRALEGDSLIEARAAVSRIVGRDTDRLSEPEVVRATVETIAESTSDGIIAPLFYLALGGPPLALAYKAINTLDSMVGYRNAMYRDFGWASARLDDAVNWAPAQITGVLLVLAAGLRTHTMGQAWRIFRRDGKRHPSPNSGRPEAAMAGALGVQLGGTNFYEGRPSERPRLGDGLESLRPVHITTALHLMAVASLMAMILAALGLCL
jgi:adenosylcobinamide-phosphate synthase